MTARGGTHNGSTKSTTGAAAYGPFGGGTYPGGGDCASTGDAPDKTASGAVNQTTVSAAPIEPQFVHPFVIILLPVTSPAAQIDGLAG